MPRNNRFRPLIQKTIEMVECALSKLDLIKHNLFVIMEAPTGYGKTISAPLIFSKLYNTGIVGSLLHVLPLRAIVRDFYLCKLIYSLKQDCSLMELCETYTSIHSEIGKALREIGLGIEDIGYQMGEDLEPYGKKEPLFGTRYTVTTLDSFLYNLYRVPVTELLKYKKHYAIPRARIFLSGVFFDEAHMIFEEHDDIKLLVASIEALEILKYMRTPVVVASATLSEGIIRRIIEKMGGDKIIHIKLCKNDESNKTICVSDKEFTESITSINWHIDFIDEDEVISKAQDAVLQGKSVFIACDTVNNAINRYRKLLSLDGISDRVILLHGKLTRKDRNEAFDKLKKLSKSTKGFVLVATSVVEAGVDISFNVLITDISDVSKIASFIQRCGRICRKINTCKDSNAEIYIVKSKICLENPLCFEFIKYIKKISGKFVPRLPFNFNNYIGYENLLRWYDVYLEEYSKRDSDLSPILKMLGRALFVSSQTINEVLKRSEYALIRTNILELFIGKEDDDKLDLERSIPLSIDYVNKILGRSPECIKYVIFLNKDGLILKRIPVEKVLVKNKYVIVSRELYNIIIDTLRKIPVETYGLLLLEKCYKQGIGLDTS